MKKIILILMLATFMLVPNVNAEVEIDPCYNDYLINLSWSNYYTKYDLSQDSWVIHSYSNSSMFDGLQYLFPSSANKTYYIKSFTGQTKNGSISLQTTFLYDENKNLLSNYSNGYNSFSVTAQNDQLIYNGLDFASFISINPKPSLREFLGDVVAIADFDLSTCPAIEEPEPIVPDTTLDNFYSIYVSKLKELSDFTIENKFVLSAFVIVLIFALLASFTHLFFGRRKR